MNRRAREFLGQHTDEIEEEAIYLLVDTPGGILLEDLAPLLQSVEKAYRRLLVLRLHEDIRDLLVRRLAEDSPLHGVSRSINFRYERLMVPKEQDYLLSLDEKRYQKREVPRSLESEDQEIWHAHYEWETGYSPFRVEVGRSTTGSPGFIELIGDPYTFSALLVFLGILLRLRQREYEQEHREEVALRDRERANAQFLAEQLGATPEEIQEVSEYLAGDLESVLDELREARMRLAPGDNVDPTAT